MDKYAVIGNPVEHSLSPVIHHAFAEQNHQAIDYSKIKAPLDGFVEAVKKFQREGGKGLNVTLPFKVEAYQLASKRSRAADEAKAASVLQLHADGTIYADNYDGLGLVQDLTRNHRVDLNQKRILIVGAGGAVQGILGALLDKAPAQLTIANRTADKARQLAQVFRLRGNVRGIGLEEIEASPYDVIIHATSLGHQQKLPSLPNGLITKNTCCYDLTYGRAAEPFLQWAKSQGATHCYDGLGMLVEHNAAVFYLWRGSYPDTEPVIRALRKKI